MQPPVLRTVMFACRVGVGRATTATIRSLRRTWSPMIQSVSLPAGGRLPAAAAARLSGVIVTISAAGQCLACERIGMRSRSFRRVMFLSIVCPAPMKNDSFQATFLLSNRPALWGRELVSQDTVWPARAVVPPPLLDEQRFHANPPQPFTDSRGRELAAIQDGKPKTGSPYRRKSVRTSTIRLRSSQSRLAPPFGVRFQ